MRQLAVFRVFCAPVVAATLLAVLPLSAARAQVFSNNAPITIPTDGTATPYPSTINVSGVVGAPSGVRVRLNNFSHTFPGDVEVLLVAPSGQGFQLLSNNGGGTGVSGLTLTFSTSSITPLSPLPTPLVTGTFVPSGGNFVFAAPANAIPRAASLQDLVPGNPNGIWRLFVQDSVGPDGGSITGGWEVEFGDFGLPTAPAAPSTFTYQGRLDGGDANGTINARFSVWSHPTSPSLLNRLVAPVTVNGIAVTNGLFTTPVALGTTLPTDIQTWLQIEISSPAGSPFVTLTPRQPITAAPIAGVAAALSRSTSLPAGDTVISGPQGELQTGSLTLRAPGAATDNNSGSAGGLLRLVAGNANTAASQPPVGTSLGNDVHIIAGDNVFGSFSGLFWNGNIQFFAGDFQPERMRIVGDNGFVGIGTTNPTQRLDVRGSIALGSAGELRAAGGVEDLRIIRGTINANGSVAFGSGFTVTRTGTGTYRVNFNTPFSSFPSVTITPEGGAFYVFVSNNSLTSVVLNVRNTFNAANDTALHFTVLGPR